MTTTNEATCTKATRIELDLPRGCTMELWLDHAMPAFCHAVSAALTGGKTDVLLELPLPVETKSPTAPIKGYLLRRIYVSVRSFPGEQGRCIVKDNGRLDAEHGMALILADSTPLDPSDGVLREWLRMIATA